MALDDEYVASSNSGSDDKDYDLESETLFSLLLQVNCMKRWKGKCSGPAAKSRLELEPNEYLWLQRNLILCSVSFGAHEVLLITKAFKSISCNSKQPTGKKVGRF